MKRVEPLHRLSETPESTGCPEHRTPPSGQFLGFLASLSALKLSEGSLTLPQSRSNQLFTRNSNLPVGPTGLDQPARTDRARCLVGWRGQGRARCCIPLLQRLWCGWRGWRRHAIPRRRLLEACFKFGRGIPEMAAAASVATGKPLLRTVVAMAAGRRLTAAVSSDS
jgi:hypothetical protein